MMYHEFMKSFFSPIRANWWVLESFRPPEPKNVWFPLSRHDVRRVHDTYHVLESFRPTEPKNVWFPLSRHDVRRVHDTYHVLESFRPTEPKNVWFPLSRHDVRRVHKMFFSRWFARNDGCHSYFGLLSLKTFDSHFLDMMYLEFMKSFFSPIRANWWVLGSLRPPEPKNVWFPLSRHDVPRVHEKFFLADSSELMGVSVISASWAQKRLIPTF